MKKQSLQLTPYRKTKQIPTLAWEPVITISAKRGEKGDLYVRVEEFPLKQKLSLKELESVKYSIGQVLNMKKGLIYSFRPKKKR